MTSLQQYSDLQAAIIGYPLGIVLAGILALLDRAIAKKFTIKEWLAAFCIVGIISIVLIVRGRMGSLAG